MLRQLRQANQARNKLWDKDGKQSITFRSTEFAGEAGEVCNVVKKLERERLGLVGSRDSVAHLAEEIADTVITADLIAMAYGIDVEDALISKFNATNEKLKFDVKLRKDNDFFNLRVALFNMGVLYSSVGVKEGFVIKFAGRILGFDKDGRFTDMISTHLVEETVDDVKRSYAQRNIAFKEHHDVKEELVKVLAENGESWSFNAKGGLREFKRG